MPLCRAGVIAAAVLIGDQATERISTRGIAIEPLVVMLVRVATATTVLVFPLAGSILALEADKWDWYWLNMGAQSAEVQALYQRWDKAVDLVYLGLAAMVMVRWPDRYLRRLALGTFFLRAFGVALFLVTDRHWLLLVFPNVFESIVLLAVLFRVITGKVHLLASGREAFLLLLALLLPKAGEEYFLHILNDRPWHVWNLPMPNALEPWFWGAAMYGVPLAALLYLASTAEGRATKGDPEVEMSVL
jgi:hypothetical protein